MTQTRPIAALFVGMLALLTGCEDSARKSVLRAAPPATTLQQAAAPSSKAAPPTSAAGQASVELAPLPLAAKRRSLLLLPPPAPGTRDDLVARVEQKFSSGQQNYKAGHLEAARKDFDAAVDLMLESGYDLNGDPKLNDLFHRVVDTVFADELQAFQAVDGFQETPAVPAPIDEVAEMTFPVDPRLKQRAEETAKKLSHCLPLTGKEE